MERLTRKITAEECYNLPDFLRVELFDGEIYTDEWTILEIDEEVFTTPPTAKRHIRYRLSVEEIEEC